MKRVRGRFGAVTFSGGEGTRNDKDCLFREPAGSSETGTQCVGKSRRGLPSIWTQLLVSCAQRPTSQAPVRASCRTTKSPFLGASSICFISFMRSLRLLQDDATRNCQV